MLAAVLAVVYSSRPLAGDTPTGVKSGEEARIATLGSMKNGCIANPAPAVDVAQVASHGTIRIVNATVRTNRFPKCPGMEIPVKVVFYKSDSNYTGQDSVTLDVAFSPGKLSKQTIAINVQ